MVPSVRVVRPKSTSAEFRREGVASAAATIGPLTPGCRVVGLTYGQFSVLEILRHVLAFTGPADVDVVTWRLGADDAEHIGWLRDGEMRIRSIRVVLGAGVEAARSRGERWVASLGELFSPAEVRVATVHAKWFTVRNAGWAVCCRSSMNVNRNKRWEQFDLDDDAAICAFFSGVVDDVFAGRARGLTVGTVDAREADLDVFGSIAHMGGSLRRGPRVRQNRSKVAPRLRGLISVRPW